MNVFVVQSSSHNPHPEIKMRNQIITYIANISLVMKSSIMAVAWKLMYSVCVSYLSWLMILKQFLTGNMNLELRIGQCAKESCVPRNIMRDMEGWREKEREYNMRDLTVESVCRKAMCYELHPRIGQSQINWIACGLITRGSIIRRKDCLNKAETCI